MNQKEQNVPFTIEALTKKYGKTMQPAQIKKSGASLDVETPEGKHFVLDPRLALTSVPLEKYFQNQIGPVSGGIIIDGSNIAVIVLPPVAQFKCYYILCYYPADMLWRKLNPVMQNALIDGFVKEKIISPSLAKTLREAIK